jgi:hypothetical protein
VATETYSLCAKIDQYSVGEYSQARGLTLEQAQEILVPGMIYVPTKHGEVEYHTEVYEYTNAPEKVESFDKIEYRDPKVVYYDGEEYLYRVNYDWIKSSEMPKYERIFTPGYLYRWESIPALGRNGWVTIDKNHKEVEIETNDASKSVYFFPTEPDIAEGDNFGYWYTDAEEIKDKDGNIGAYNPYTLYKWEGDHWLAVARLAGNCNNRVASLVTQTTNSLSAEITNARGSTASIGERITNTESEVYSIAQWTINPDTGEQYSLATIKQTADAAGASISQIVEWAGPDGVVSTSSIVQSINDSGSEVYIDADHIRLEGVVTMDSNITITKDGKIIAKNAEIEGDLTATSGYIGGFTIEDEKIYTGLKSSFSNSTASGVYIGPDGISVGGILVARPDLTTYYANVSLDASTGKLIANNAEITGKITATEGYIGDSNSGFVIGSSSIYNKKTAYNDTTDGVYIGTDGIGLGQGKFWVSNTGEMHSESGAIGGWNITKDYIHKGSLHLMGTDAVSLGSLISNKEVSPVRIGVGLSGLLPNTFTRSNLSTADYDIVDGYIYIAYKADNEVLSAWLSDYGCSDEEYGEYMFGNAVITIDYDVITIAIPYPYDDVASFGFSISYIYDTDSEFKFALLEDGSLYANASKIEGEIFATAGRIGYKDENNSGWEISTNMISCGDVSLYTGDDYIEDVGTDRERKVRISIGDDDNLSKNPFRVFNNGHIIASNGQIGSCNFRPIIYPVVGKDLDNILNYKITSEYIESDWKFVHKLRYKVKVSPKDDYSLKTFEPYSYSYNAEIYTSDAFDWYWAWTDSSSEPPADSVWSPGWMFEDMDTSVINQTRHLWLKCLITRRDGLDSYGQPINKDIDTMIFYIGDFYRYCTIFDFGDGFISIGERVITGKTSSIEFKDDCSLLSGTWYYGDAEIATSSWRGAKFDIEKLDNRYSTLFDELRPVRFKYNNGQSDRYHTGFILDELKSAMDKSNVSTSELAAYCISDEATGKGGIRYSEFIALCVDQIQKLKRRVEELENK